MNLSLFIGFRYTGARRKSRSVSFLSGMSIAGLAVGVALLILVLSVMNGFDRELRQRILSLVPQAAIYHRDVIYDWPSLKTAVEEHESVVAASPFVQLNGLVSLGKEAVFVSLYGFSPEAEESVSLVNQLVDREVLARVEQGDPVILLGKQVAESLKAQVGDKVMVVVPDRQSGTSSPKVAYMEIAAVVESQTELDTTLALTGLNQAAKLSHNPNGVSGLRLKIRDLFNAPSLMYELNVSLGADYYTSNWTRTHWNLYQAIHMSKNLVGLLMSLIVAIAAFNVVSTLVLVVVDKQGDIAILRTLGAKNQQIMGVFIAQGVAIGLIGTGIGVAVGCAMAMGIQQFVVLVENALGIQFLRSDVYPLTYMPTEIRLSDIVTTASTALFLSFIATLYPAWKATRVQPAVALRYE